MIEEIDEGLEQFLLDKGMEAQRLLETEITGHNLSFMNALLACDWYKARIAALDSELKVMTDKCHMAEGLLSQQHLDTLSAIR